MNINNLDRLMRKVEITDGCWLFKGWRDKLGYGRFMVGKHQTAHRSMWVLKIGPIPPSMYVCHRCDNPPCVNPDHLFLGTNQDNIYDSIKKGRHINPPRLFRGKHPGAKITPKQANQIVIMYKCRLGSNKKVKAGQLQEIANAYKVSTQCIKNIVKPLRLQLFGKPF